METASQEELLAYKDEVEERLNSAEMFSDYLYWKDQLFSITTTLRLYYP